MPQEWEKELAQEKGKASIKVRAQKAENTVTWDLNLGWKLWSFFFLFPKCQIPESF